MCVCNTTQEAKQNKTKQNNQMRSEANASKNENEHFFLVVCLRMFLHLNLTRRFNSYV